MTRNYTLEDIETLRSKASVSYEDAVALLDKYDGDIARALIELEKSGRLNSAPKETGSGMTDFTARIKDLWRKGLTTRIIIERKGTCLVNLSVSFLLLMTVLGIYSMLCALLLTLMSGCSISIRSAAKHTDQSPEDTSSESSPDTTASQPASEASASDNESEEDEGYSGITIS